MVVTTTLLVADSVHLWLPWPLAPDPEARLRRAWKRMATPTKIMTTKSPAPMPKRVRTRGLCSRAEKLASAIIKIYDSTVLYFNIVQN